MGAVTRQRGDKTVVKANGTDPITAALKRIHDDVVEEPMPDSFLDLVAQIEAKIAARTQ